MLFLLSNGAASDYSHTSIRNESNFLTYQLLNEYKQTNDYKMTLINFTPDLNKIVVKHLASRNLNPGNLRSFRTGEFREFETLKEGYLALIKDIEIKQTGRSHFVDADTPLWDYIHVYAPTFENNSARYARLVANGLNVSLNTPINQINKHDLAKWIIKAEDRSLYKLMYNDEYIQTKKEEITTTINVLINNQDVIMQHTSDYTLNGLIQFTHETWKNHGKTIKII